MMRRKRTVLSAARGKIMQTAVIKRSIVLDGHKTSVSLENEFWNALREIAVRENTTLSTLVGKIDHDRNSCNLSSAIRVHVFSYFRARMGNQEPVQARLNPDGRAASRSEMAC
jgi:predicted DNA-binding ribbon-helix-helix protein